ncbi:MAG: hypothetical protein WAV41_04045 [Microgenomates group bacterium]
MWLKYRGYIFFVLSIFLAILVSKHSLVLRYFNYETYPLPNLDEYNYIWQAISLKKTGLPMAWSLNSGEYGNKLFGSIRGEVGGFSIDNVDLNKFLQDRKPLTGVVELDYLKGKEQILMVAPFFDHPPIGGMIYEWGMPDNVETVEAVRPADFRKSAIVMAVITGGLLYILLLMLYGNPWVPLIALIVYSTVPTYILATRTAYLENAVSPLILMSLIFVYLSIEGYEKRKSMAYETATLIVAGIIGGMAVLTKEPAIGFLGGLVILMGVYKLPYKNIFIFLTAVAVPILIYISWGLWLQKDLFVAIFATNSHRGYFGAIKMVTQLEALKLKNFPVDGWWIWGWISFFIISLRIRVKKVLFITLPLAAHLLTILLVPSPNYPWYLMSSIPFLAACSGIFIWEIMQKPNWAKGIAFFLVPFSSSYYWGREALNLVPSIGHYRNIFFVFIVILGMRLRWPKVGLVRYIWWLFFGYLIYRIFIYNEVAFPYLMAHWGSLPVPSLPNY